jgi:hypothetical protein
MAGSNGLRRVARRPYWREADARVVVDAWRDSGESLASFGGRHGVSPRRLARWATRLKGGREVRFHPVRLVEPPTQAEDRSLAIELPGGETVRLPTGFELDDLRRVLAALAERHGC